MKRILSATDGSQHARKAVAFAADLARHFDAELLITHVVVEGRIPDESRHLIETEYAADVRERLGQIQPATDNAPDLLPQAAALDYEATATAIHDLLGEHVLKAAEEHARECGAARVHTVLAHGDPAKAILSIADEDNIDLIVVASRGLGEMRALLLGSVSNKIAHLAHCSVVLVR